MAHQVTHKRAHKDLDRALNQAHKEGFGYGYIEGVTAERMRIVDILRSVNAYGLQVVLNTEAETYQTEQTMDTEDLVRAIESEND